MAVKKKTPAPAPKKAAKKSKAEREARSVEAHKEIERLAKASGRKPGLGEVQDRRIVENEPNHIPSTGNYARDWTHHGRHEGKLGEIPMGHIYKMNPNAVLKVFYLGHKTDVGTLYPDGAMMVVSVRTFDRRIKEALAAKTGVDPDTIIAAAAVKANSSGPSEKASDDKEPRQPKAKSNSSGGGYTLADLCKKLNLEPGEARRILRSKKIEKPGGRWEWPNEEAASSVEKALKG